MALPAVPNLVRRLPLLVELGFERSPKIVENCVEVPLLNWSGWALYTWALAASHCVCYINILVY
jgi:hypothetical protein